MDGGGSVMDEMLLFLEQRYNIKKYIYSNINKPINWVGGDNDRYTGMVQMCVYFRCTLIIKMSITLMAT